VSERENVHDKEGSEVKNATRMKKPNAQRIATQTVLQTTEFLSDCSSSQPKALEKHAPRLSVASLAVSRSRFAAPAESSNSDSSVVMLAAAGDEDGYLRDGVGVRASEGRVLGGEMWIECG
jgi:hypothetical protein